MRLPTMSACGLLAAAALTLGSWKAEAHPHVWITAQTTVVHDNGTFTGLQHRWTFDAFYSAMETEGLDKNKDGKFDREELSELAKFYVNGLKEYGYFTFPALAGNKLELGEPRDVWLDYTDGLLSLNFTMPLAQPVLTEAKGFAFAVYDPTFYIALEMDKADSVKMSTGTPAGCKATIGDHAKDQSNEKALNEAFSAQFGGSAFSNAAKAVSVECGGS